MTSTPHHDTDARAILADTERDQRRASDPAASAWVSANAGAGKTHVLKMRVLRLMLAGTPPQRILCLTYTKAAAAEMAARVFADLARWATATPEDLTATLSSLLGHPPQPADVVRARQLFALSVETPGGLKVQTIHAFCEKLLQRFPLEAGVAPGFQILDEGLAAELRRTAIDAALSEAVRDRGSEIGGALSLVVARAQGEGFDDLIRAAMSNRSWLSTAERLDDATDDDAGGAAKGSARKQRGRRTLEQRYRAALGLRSRVSEADLMAEMADVLSPASLTAAVTLLARGGKTDLALAAGLQEAQSLTIQAGTLANSQSNTLASTQASNAARAAALRPVFLTGSGEARADSRFITKKLREADPVLTDVLIRARDSYAALAKERVALGVVQCSLALVTIVDAIQTRYHAAKAMRAALDFDDLVTKAARLLASPEDAQWVLYKLDGGLDHILVDEAQDTSAEQWRVAGALAAEFFADTSADARPRTVFAVGDEKQSIYSFQGAAPEMFRATGDRFAAEAERARRTLARIPLRLSFRTVRPLLAAIDAVFAVAERTPGVGADPVRHLALRQGQAGLVEVWPTETADDGDPSDAFAPLDETPPTSAVVRLAARIADQIAAWLESGELLASANRPIRPGDIIILLRKRTPFAGPMVAALKRRGIAVAGSDRIVITDQIAVQDLMSLADVLLLPEDDLALAEVLKSPLLGLDDDDLIVLAAERKGSLWQALLDAAKSSSRYAAVAEQLKHWRRRADFLPPFEFFAELLDGDGGRARLLARLGPDAAEPLDELVSLALAYDEANPPSMQGFLHWLRADRREIKRDLEHGRDQVRVMTVHGAKGLEAPIVFLPDTCSAPTSSRPSPVTSLTTAERRPGEEPLKAWVIADAKALDAIADARADTRRREIEESNRLLYVALTRARDRLYIAGFEGARGPATGCWYETIRAGLDGQMDTITDDVGRTVLRLSVPQTAASETERAERRGHAVPQPRPDWARLPASRERRLAVPLAPSRLAPLDSDEDGEPREPALDPVRGEPPREPASISPRARNDDSRFLRGTLTHALLEHLPSLPHGSRAAAARGFLASRAPDLSARLRTSIVKETIAVLEDPRFAAVFGPDSRSEVSIAADIAPPTGKGLPLRLSGQIDRMVRLHDDVIIVDFKTNRPPPSRPEDVANAYILQLAAYRLALKQANPGCRVRAALLWTDGPALMELDAAQLDRAEAELWTLASARVDV